MEGGDTPAKMSLRPATFLDETISGFCFLSPPLPSPPTFTACLPTTVYGKPTPMSVIDTWGGRNSRRAQFTPAYTGVRRSPDA